MTSSERGDTWAVGVAGWIIQDGNYPDFVTGEERDFAVELLPHPNTITRTDRGATPHASVVEGATHEFFGRVVFTAASDWVVDIGLLVYGHSDDLDQTAVGDTIAGTAYLGISGPGVYPEGFFVAAPAHVYRWRINSIQRETTPRPERSRRLGAIANTSFVEVERTNAWEDDFPRDPHYILQCVPLSQPPR